MYLLLTVFANTSQPAHTTHQVISAFKGIVLLFLFIQPLLEDLSRLAGERKVTFDVTESDLSSTLDPPDGAGNTYRSLSVEQ